jgi:hypothetical protein
MIPYILFLSDVRHLGTVGQGLFAELIVNAIDAKFHAGVAPMLQREILDFAAIGRVGAVHVAGTASSSGSQGPTEEATAATRDGQVTRVALPAPSSSLP